MISRTERQEQLLQNIIKNKFRCWYSAFPGFGKTRCAINTMKYILDKKPSCSFAIIVPSITLQKQWTELLLKANIPKFKVTVINSIVLKEIIVDEDCTFMDKPLSI